MSNLSFDDDSDLQKYIRKVVYAATEERLLNLPRPFGYDTNAILRMRSDVQHGRDIDLLEKGKQYVAIIVRAQEEEALGSIALLTREAKHGSFFFPTGKGRLKIAA